MNHRPIITVFAAGAALTLGACKGRVEEVTHNPPMPVPVQVDPPPAPDAPDTSGLPAWDAVVSGHPEGATNPPIPVLSVTPDGRCFKAWMSPMRPNPGGFGDRVRTDCDTEDCGTPVQCPEDRVAALLAEPGAPAEPPAASE